MRRVLVRFVRFTSLTVLYSLLILTGLCTKNVSASPGCQQVHDLSLAVEPGNTYSLGPNLHTDLTNFQEWVAGDQATLTGSDGNQDIVLTPSIAPPIQNTSAVVIPPTFKLWMASIYNYGNYQAAGLSVDCISAPQTVGFAITGSQLTACPGGICKFNAMNGQWTVPTVTYATYPNGPAKQYSSVWLGVGTGSGLNSTRVGNHISLDAPQGDGTLVRMGTEQDVDDQGNTTYFAWYQLYPNDPVMLPSAQYPVHAGDVISAGPSCASNPCTNWEIIIADHTQNWVFDQIFPYSSSQLSAEWMVGSDSTTNDTAPLPQLASPVIFSTVTINAGTAMEVSIANNAVNPDLGVLTPCGAVDFPGSAILYIGQGNCASTPLSAYTHDFNCDGFGDLLWRFNNGEVAAWLLQGAQVLQTANLGTVANTWSIVGTHKFTSACNADILWHDSSGNLAMWFVNGLQLTSTASLGNVPTNWAIFGTGDLNGDGIGDLLWRDSNTGTVAVWYMNGSQVSQTATLGSVPSTWNIVGDNNRKDIFWRDSSGNLAVWQLNGSQVQSVSLGNVPINWVIAGLGDFNGDGYTDILWRDNNSGTVAIWFMNGLNVLSATNVAMVPTSSTWNIVETGDYNGDGMSDILWIDGSGNVAIWFMNGATITSNGSLGNVGTNWSVQSVNAE